MADYVQLALTEARKLALTAAAVVLLDYRGIAGLCGVMVTARGGSPTDFFYGPTRDAVARELQADEAEAAQKARLAAAQERLRLDWPKTIVLVDSTEAERLFFDGVIPAGVTEKQWRVIPVAEAVL